MSRIQRALSEYQPLLQEVILVFSNKVLEAFEMAPGYMMPSAAKVDYAHRFLLDKYAHLTHYGLTGTVPPFTLMQDYGPNGSFIIMPNTALMLDEMIKVASNRK